MNYIKLINTFWEIERQHGGFKAQHQSFYFALCYFANKAEWEEFEVYREDVIEQAKIGKNTYYELRDFFKELGMIDFVEGANKRTKVRFKMLQVSLKRDNSSDTIRDSKPVPVSPISDMARDMGSDTLSDHTNKPINPKTFKPSFEKEAKLGIGENFDVELDEIFSGNDLETLESEIPATQTGGAREIFEAARQLWPGRRNGSEVEWENFNKKYPKEQAETATLLLEAIKREIAWRQKAAAYNACQPRSPVHIPFWAHFSTYVNQQRWTQEMEVIPDQVPASKPGGAVSQLEKRFNQVEKIIKTREYDQQGNRIRS